MDIRKQVVAEITRLNKILALLDDSDDGPAPATVDGRTKAGRAAAGRKGRKTMSAAARKKISSIQKLRWARWRKEKGQK